eukprot:CAMPEP_0113318718 /NCGR_PEP_ID=MMETSP0010_2-20120614/13179_1 /TAXON_ID=216773 ORGANISM="Corethron hystrix, Strain 308" /NCGR_SAMPLE_ID=MMETSP0010_2 /ASSEMBLY_ACC=CAM_ASM_000155 /LENGTH=106 /DNA_ID=CAMNT_0000176085 /DNA_START=990 /DNA_END=1310 /DNA_ORIENTATION=- /assembly_acc=CAM_ASM_000155
MEVVTVDFVEGAGGGGRLHGTGQGGFGFGPREGVVAVNVAHVGLKQILQTRYAWFFPTDEFVSIFVETDIDVVQQLEPVLYKNVDIILAIDEGKIILFLLKLFFGG